MKFDKAPNSKQAIDIFNKIILKESKDAARKIDKPFVIYGAGNLGSMAFDFFNKIEQFPDFIVDKNISLSNIELANNNKINLLNPESVSCENRKKYLIIVCVVTSSYEKIYESLNEQGWSDIVHFYDVTEAYIDVYPLSNGWILNELNENEISNIKLVISKWEDDTSRAHFLQFIAWHKLREEWTFLDSENNINDRYFIESIKKILNHNESFLDVGAHEGEVCEKFISLINNYKSIEMIEPDPLNYEKIIKKFKLNKNYQNQKIKLFPLVISSGNEKVSFYGGLGYTSQISEKGQNILTTYKVDQLDLSPSFIKIHLEGWELEALKGMKNTIKKNKPIIVTTSYHNKLGVCELPMWLLTNLKKEREDYKLFFRQHGWCGTGGVIYCVPVSR